MKNTYLFILSAPYSGSTVLWRLLQTSSQVSALPDEGQKLPELRTMMRDKPWDPKTCFDWDLIYHTWHSYWDSSKAVLLEKSPPHLCRVATLQAHFQPARYILLLRDPLAICEALNRRNGMDWTQAAERWIHWLRLHLDCRQALAGEAFRVLYYEDMVSQPGQSFTALGTWLPSIADVDPFAAIEAHAIDGVQRRPLLNIDSKKLARVGARERGLVLAALRQERQLLEQTPYAATYL
jgi:hypothetical protein